MKNPLRKALIAALLIPMCFPALAQTFFDTRFEAVPIDIKPAQSQHGYVVAANIGPWQSAVPCLLEFDVNGQMVDQKRYTSNQGFKIEQFASLPHGYALALRSNAFELAISKLNPDYSVYWTKRFLAPPNTRWTGLLPQSDGGVIGLVDELYFHDNRFYLIKLGNTGNLIWSKAYDVSLDLQMAKMVQLANGDIALAGPVDTWSGSQFAMARLNSQGDVLWINSFGDDVFNDVVGIAEFGNGNIAIASNCQNIFWPGSFSQVVDVDASGNFTWAKLPSLGDLTIFSGGSPSPNGHVAFYGRYSNPYSHSLVVDFDQDGNIHWAFSPCAPNEPMDVWAMFANPYGAILFAGSSAVASGDPGFIVKTNSLGASCHRSELTVQTQPKGFNLGPLVCTVSNGPGINLTFLFADTLTVDHAVHCLLLASPDSYPSQAVGQVHPNPVQSVGTFKDALGSFDPGTTLLLTDMLGRTHTIPSEVSGNTLSFSRGSMPAGVYVYTLRAQGILFAQGKLLLE